VASTSSPTWGGLSHRGLAPALPWAQVWATAAILFASFFGGIEAFWRGRAVESTVSDSKELWRFWRQRVYQDDGKVLVLLGTSRIRADIALPVLERDCGLRCVQLGVDGTSSPIGPLRDLAMDSHFNGVVLCSLFIPFIERSRWGDCDALVEYRPERFVLYCDSLVSSWCQSHLAIVNKRCSLVALVHKCWLSGKLPSPSLAVYGFDRSIRMWPGQLDGSVRETERQQFRGWRVPKFSDLNRACEEVDSFVRSIRSRGGAVGFIHLPSSGSQLADEERTFPKALYWDEFAKRVSAPCVYCGDVSALRSYTCPDGVHLSERQSVGFTEALAKQLRRVGLCKYSLSGP
jgi:hypothetical protein